MYWGLGLQHFGGGQNSTHSSRSITIWPFYADWLGTCCGGEAQKCYLCLLQVLERWCESPRTIEVLMNTYSTMQLPEEAVGLVPLETLQVRFQDPEHTHTQPACPQGTPAASREAPFLPPTLPQRNDPETHLRPSRRRPTG